MKYSDLLTMGRFDYERAARKGVTIKFSIDGAPMRQALKTAGTGKSTTATQEELASGINQLIQNYVDKCVAHDPRFAVHGLSVGKNNEIELIALVKLAA